MFVYLTIIYTLVQSFVYNISYLTSLTFTVATIRLYKFGPVFSFALSALHNVCSATII